MKAAVTGLVPVSIICVSNDEEVLRDCLQRSFDAREDRGSRSELIVINNTGNPFTSAGAALNHGVQGAANDVCVFVHQDVYLHSIAKLEEAAWRVANDDKVGMAGAVGITTAGDLAGRIRDRVLLLGQHASTALDVDSLDEVLFMARRSMLMMEPLSVDPLMAWHAYAVEYGARMLRKGKRVVALNVPLTHNSLTINLAKLDQAHAKVGRMYPELLPLQTTCGVIQHSVAARPGWIAALRAAARKAQSQVLSRGARRVVAPGKLLLGDIRFDIDGFAASQPAGEISVVNALDSYTDEAMEAPLKLNRIDRSFNFSTLPISDISQSLSTGAFASEPVIITNLGRKSLGFLINNTGSPGITAGYDKSTGYWLAIGFAASPTFEPTGPKPD